MLLRRKLRFVRMDPHRGINPIVLAGNRGRRVEPLRPAAAANRQNGVHACCARPLQHLCAIRVKLGKLQVRM